MGDLTPRGGDGVSQDGELRDVVRGMLDSPAMWAEMTAAEAAELLRILRGVADRKRASGG